MATSETAQALVGWFGRTQRALPWRASKEPYHVLVAEFLLQQTQVRTALPVYDRILERWPTLAALAAADEQEVLAEWSGLGYYRRARNLLAAARRIVADHGGVVPRDLATLRSLPGVGPYTAGAIASVAYGVRAPAVDGNVLRVVGRVLDRADDPTRAPYRHAVEAWVGRLLEHAEAGAVNQALMDLGNLVCTPRAPQCPACPLAPGCAAYHAGHPERIPVRKARHRPTERYVAVIAWRGDRLLVEPLHGHGVLEGLWGPPLRRRAPSGSRALACVTHTFSHRRWEVVPHVARRPSGRSRDARWVTLEQFAALPTSGLGRRLVEVASAHRE